MEGWGFITKHSAFCGNTNGGQLTSGDESVGASGHFEKWNARRGRVARPVTEHLVCQSSANFWRLLLWISCHKRNFSPTICSPTKSWIVEKDQELSQMWPSKVEGVKWWKRRTTEHLEDYYRTRKKVFESRSIAFMVQDDL
jgi:hypothetical protein